MSKELGVSFLH